MFEQSTQFGGESLIIGFDLGTTNSVVSFYNNAIPEVILIDGLELIPSFVEFTPNMVLKAVGQEAKNNRKSPYTVSSFKKYMGTDKKIIWDYTAEDISTIFVAEVFRKLREQHSHLASANAVVVSVPAYFNMNQINATKNAFRRNGIKIVDVNIEPVSAALVYKEIKQITDPILVFDLGGGTFDAVLITGTTGIPKESVELYKAAGIKLAAEDSKLSILDITGNNMLGGDNIDEAAIRRYKQATNSHLSDKDLLAVVELVKHSGNSSGDFYHVYVEQATMEIFAECMSWVTPMLNRNNIQKVHCVLCGGSTKSQLIKDALKKHFKVSSEINPDLSVSIGNSMYAGKSQIIQRTPKHIGMLVSRKFKTVIPKGTVIPVSKTISVKNSIPFEKAVDVKIYQANSLMSDAEHISTIEISGLTGHDSNGFVVLGVRMEYLLDGTINVNVTGGNQESKTTLSYVDSVQAPQEPSLIAMIRKANGKLKDTELTRLLEEWSETQDNSLVAKMNKRLVACRKK